MSTPAQIAANQTNSQKSTGPRTEAGKQTSSRNSTRHGLYSKARIIKGESQEAYDAFHLQVMTDLAPVNDAEVYFADDVADNLWRLERMRRFEAQEFERVSLAAFETDAETAPPDLRRLNLLTTMTSRIRRDIASSLRCYRQAQQDRLRREKEQLPPAIAIRRADLAANRDTHLQEFGFDLSVDFVDAQISRQDALRQAENTLEMFARAHAAPKAAPKAA